MACPWQPSHLALQVVVANHLPQRAESTKTTPNRTARVHTENGDTEAQSWEVARPQAPPQAPPTLPPPRLRHSMFAKRWDVSTGFLKH